MIDRPTSEDRFESAEFAPVRVGGGRRRSWGPVLIAGWLVVLGAVVGVGTLGRSGPGKPDQAAALARAGASPGTVATSGEVRAPDVGPARPSDPDPVGYVVRPDSAGYTITGTILARPTVWVFISIQDLNGNVVTWRSLSVEDPDGGIRPTHTPAFLVHVNVPAAIRAMPLWVEVNAYNNVGRKIGSVRTAIGWIGRGGIHPKTSLMR